MAERRMFAKSIVLSDAFLDMPATARCLYFTLGMFADDDGFVGSPKAIMRQCGASQDDMNVLIAKKFVLVFESGVIVIKHWRMNNYLQNDRHKDTNYIEEMSKLKVGKNGAYYATEPLGTSQCIQSVYTVKDSIDKLSIGKDNKYIPASETDAEPQCESWFTAFWDSYPKKKDKANAVKAFRKVCKTEEDYNTIMSGLMNQIPLWKDPQYIPYPATWLNGKRWEDDLSTDKQKQMSPMQRFLYGGLDER